MNLEIPQFVTLADGTTAQVKGVAANLIDGRLEQIVYTVEKGNGAWTDIASEDVRPQEPAAVLAGANPEDGQ